MSDRTIRNLTALTVLMVAAIAAIVSYQHLYHLAITHGETRLDAALLPLSIDGAVVTGSLLMLRAARLGLGTPWLARIMLAIAVTMTVAANVAFGWQQGAWGILMAGWPAAAFLMNAEGSISFGRKARQLATEIRTAGADLPTVAADAQAAAKLALAASVAAGNPISQRQLMTRFGLTRTAERKVREEVRSAANGHASHQ